MEGEGKGGLRSFVRLLGFSDSLLFATRGSFLRLAFLSLGLSLCVGGQLGSSFYGQPGILELFVDLFFSPSFFFFPPCGFGVINRKKEKTTRIWLALTFSLSVSSGFPGKPSASTSE